LRVDSYNAIFFFAEVDKVVGLTSCASCSSFFCGFVSGSGEERGDEGVGDDVRLIGALRGIVKELRTRLCSENSVVEELGTARAKK
jgi:hypothetical protein